MTDFMEKIQSRLIFDRFSMVRKLGFGGSADVYIGRHVNTGEEVAMRFQHQLNQSPFFGPESHIFGELQGVHGFPTLHWEGHQDDFDIKVMELLGPSLQDLFAFCDWKFSLKTVLMITDQVLERLQAIHSRGFHHRDIKPDNFLLGMGQNGNTIYAIDFGIALRLNSEEEEEREERREAEMKEDENVFLVGTVNFASINGHVGGGRGPKDDLESLVYMLVYFLKGRLPWQVDRASDRERESRIAGEKKRKTAVEELCRDLPDEFAQCLKYAKSLKTTQWPDYFKLRQLFKDLAVKEGFKYDDVYDWTIRKFLEEA